MATTSNWETDTCFSHRLNNGTWSHGVEFWETRDRKSVPGTTQTRTSQTGIVSGYFRNPHRLFGFFGDEQKVRAISARHRPFLVRRMKLGNPAEVVRVHAQRFRSNGEDPPTHGSSHLLCLHAPGLTLVTLEHACVPISCIPFCTFFPCQELRIK